MKSEHHMGILEKLRPQPRWKHADPGVRAAAVYDLGPDEVEALATLAREDGDARVRRVAATRIDDLGVLGDIARTDPDEEVRVEAVRGLAGVAAEADSVDQATRAVGHLLALGRLKEVVAVARGNPSADVRHAVVDLLDDSKALGAISRHAQDGTTRLRALARLVDPDEIVNVAVKSEHTDVAVSALDSVVDQAALGLIAQRARNKVAARRARTKLRQLEETARGPANEPVAEMDAGDRARAIELVHRTEALVATADPDEASGTLSSVRLAWAELQADADIDPTLAQGFEVASEAAQEAVEQRRQERAADEARERALAQEQADRLGIVGEIEQLAGAAAQDRIAELRVQWDSLPPMPSEYAASLTRRFQDASRGFEGRERRRMLAEAAVGRLETLATELEHLVASEQPSEEVVARWRGLRRDAEVLREHSAANVSAAARLERAVEALEEKEGQWQEVRARQEQDNLRRLQQLARQVDSLAESPELTLKAGDRALHEIQAALDERAPLPSKGDRQEMQDRLARARGALGPRVQELRDEDDWQRWANLQIQESLCRDMEALKAEENLEQAARRMRELQGRWKPVALAPRAQGESMWRRFKTAQDEVYARTATFFAEQHAARAASLLRKQDLCARAEALAESTDWVNAATALRALQAEWKGIGAAVRGQEKAVWDRFRKACDRFFSRRQEDLKQRKDVWAANLAQKDALCARAEALADSTDWEDAARQLKQLQAEWKTVGPVRKSKSESTWQRFRAACDRFFDRYKHRHEVDLEKKAAAHQEVIAALGALLPAAGVEPGPAPDNLSVVVRDARSKWQQAPELPRSMHQPLADRYAQALIQIVAAWPMAFAGTDLDPDATRKRMERLIARVEELGGTQVAATPALSPTELLARQWRDRLAANTMAGGTHAAEAEASRWRITEQEVRSVQAQWSRLGPVPADVAARLGKRFERACREFFERRRRAS
jgi:hypothetical protein